MGRGFGLPEISVEELAEALKTNADFYLVDVREAPELSRARIDASQMVELPLSRLAQEGPGAIPDHFYEDEKPLYILCHHGNRSAQVTNWLLQQGLSDVKNIAGGIAAYAKRVDPKVGQY